MSMTLRPTWRATSGSRLAKANGSWRNTLLHPIQLTQPVNLVQPTGQLAQLVNLVQLTSQPAKAQLTAQSVNLDQRQPMVQLTQLVKLDQLTKVQPRLKTSKYLKAHKPQLKHKSLKPLRDCHQAKAQPRNGSPSVNQAAHILLKTANTMDATNFPVHT